MKKVRIRQMIMIGVYLMLAVCGLIYKFLR